MNDTRAFLVQGFRANAPKTLSRPGNVGIGRYERSILCCKGGPYRIIKDRKTGEVISKEKIEL